MNNNPRPKRAVPITTRVLLDQLAEGAASLLPDGPRPAIVFHVRVDPSGQAKLDGAERSLIRSRAKLAYETVQLDSGALPLLAPMSEVAGRMSIQAGAHALEKAQGGSGVLLGGVPGVKPAEVLVIGGGVVGINAARMAMGLNAHVTILDRSLDRLKYLDEVYGDKLTTIYSTHDAIEAIAQTLSGQRASLADEGVAVLHRQVAHVMRLHEADRVAAPRRPAPRPRLALYTRSRPSLPLSKETDRWPQSPSPVDRRSGRSRRRTSGA